jgi:hypothetical protein
MTSKGVATLLADLGGGRTHSRPHVSNDNAYSEAAFKTLKYCPTFPARFGSIADARLFAAEFFEHYNHVHRHSGIGLHTPASVHYGTATEIRAERGPHPRRRRCRQSSPVLQPATHATQASDRCVDQQPRHERRSTEVIPTSCLKGLDWFRS